MGKVEKKFLLQNSKRNKNQIFYLTLFRIKGNNVINIAHFCTHWMKRIVQYNWKIKQRIVFKVLKIHETSFLLYFSRNMMMNVYKNTFALEAHKTTRYNIKALLICHSLCQWWSLVQYWLYRFAFLPMNLPLDQW